MAFEYIDYASQLISFYILVEFRRTGDII